MEFMNTINYWRNSIADAERCNLDFSKLPDSFDVELPRLKDGLLLNSKEIARFFAIEEFKERSIISVIIAPVIMQAKKEHGEGKSKIPIVIPFLIPAKLDKLGNLSIDEGIYPWIPREYLEPCNKDIVVGSLDDMDTFLSKNTMDVASWSEYWKYCESFFTAVSGNVFQDYSHEQLVVLDRAKIGIYTARQGMASGILNLYDNIIKSGISNELLKNYSSLEDVERRSLLDKHEFDAQSYRHLGQMNKFSASESQREALHHLFMLEEGDILAVNGPPGTGKTTLLQSIISSSWINAAYKKDNPPIIVVSSTNNQAVTNVIDSFGVSGNFDHILGERWIPNVQSYGLYLVSQNAYRKETWHSLTNGLKNADEFANKFESQEFISTAEQYFLQKYNNWTNAKFNSLSMAIEDIHSKLCQQVDKQHVIIKSYFDYESIIQEQINNYPKGIDFVIEECQALHNENFTELEFVKQLDIEWTNYLLMEPWWFSSLNFFPFKKHVQNKKKLRDKLFILQHELHGVDENNISEYIQDIKFNLQERQRDIEQKLIVLQQIQERFESIKLQWKKLCIELKLDPEISKISLFEWLDCHYRYPNFFLATHYWECCWLLEVKNKDSTRRSRKSQEEKWRRYAKLTPCMVVTLHMLPKFFSAYYNGQNIPLDNFIDLLIIDEAGQVSPEVAGASFVLAKKALLIGDTKQIEPVWSIPKAIDVHNLVKAKIAENIEQALEYIENKGISASSGSAMVIAQQRSRFQKFDVGGMYLLEHRRCLPEIISYCNELAYGGHLKLLRNSIKSGYQLPHIGYAHVNGIMRRNGGSLSNEFEAQAIANWIADNQEHLSNMYPEIELKNIIAIITPFSKQWQLINERLKKIGIHGLTVGTVHALQGAERPIIIFSTVYDTTYQSTYFFDRKINLLNVAVSRAKDSFLVFGNMSVFDMKSNSPSGLLARYLFAKETNEIKNVCQDRFFEKNSADIVQHLHDLTAHRQQLKNCILSCAREVHIISPYLSSVAIEADKLIETFKRGILNGTKITVYTDSQLSLQREPYITNFKKAQQLLSESGVILRIVKRIHNKTIWVDKKILIEGSFNWLSAVRDPSSEWCRYESSLVYQGDKVSKMIDKVYLDLQSRILPDS